MDKVIIDKCLAVLDETHFAFDDGAKKNFFKEQLSIHNQRMKTFSAFRQKLVVLRGLARFEAAARMKIAKMPPDMIDDLFYGYNATSIGTLKTYHSIIREYLLSMAHNSEELEIGSLYIMNMTLEDLKKYLNTKAYYNSTITPKMIDTYVKKSMEVDPCAMSAAVLIWEGAPVPKLPEIKVTDVSFDEAEGVVKVLVDGEVYTTQYVELFKAALSQKVVYVIDDDSKEKAKFLLRPESEYFIKNTHTTRDDGLKKITIGKMKSRIKMLAVYFRNKQFNAQNIIASKKVYELVKHFDFKKQSHTTYCAYLAENNISFNTAQCNAITTKMLQKLEDEKEGKQ